MAGNFAAARPIDLLWMRFAFLASVALAGAPGSNIAPNAGKSCRDTYLPSLEKNPDFGYIASLTEPTDGHLSL